MVPHTGQQIILKNILPNIWRSKHKQVMKFQLVKHSMKNIFLQKSCRKWGRESSSRPVLIFKKSLFKVNASDHST